MNTDKFIKYYIKYNTNQSNLIYKKKLEFYTKSILKQNGGNYSEIVDIIKNIQKKYQSESKIITNYKKDILGKINSLIINYESIYKNLKNENEKEINKLKSEIDSYKLQLKNVTNENSSKDILENKIKERNEKINELIKKNNELEQKIKECSNINKKKLEPVKPNLSLEKDKIIKNNENNVVLSQVNLQKPKPQINQKNQDINIKLNELKNKINSNPDLNLGLGLSYFVDGINLIEIIEKSNYANKVKEDYRNAIIQELEKIFKKHESIKKAYIAMNKIKEEEKQYSGNELNERVCRIFDENNINYLFYTMYDKSLKNKINTFLYDKFYNKYQCNKKNIADVTNNLIKSKNIKGGNIYMFGHSNHYDVLDSTPYVFDKYNLISDNINNLIKESTINLYDLFEQYYNFIKNYNEDINEIIEKLNSFDKDKINEFRFDYPDYEVLKNYNFAPKDVIPIIDIMKNNFDLLLGKLEELKNFLK